jgi:hypothetical protein
MFILREVFVTGKHDPCSTIVSVKPITIFHELLNRQKIAKNYNLKLMMDVLFVISIVLFLSIDIEGFLIQMANEFRPGKLLHKMCEGISKTNARCTYLFCRETL